MDSDFNVVSEFINCCYNLDKESYEKAISEDCKISYYFNSHYNECNKDKYIEELTKGHFENTIEVKVENMGIRRGKESAVFKTEEVALFTRKGLGRDESAPGLYLMKSYGTLKVSNNKIIEIFYMFNKYTQSEI